MPKDTSIKRTLVIGSGPIVIGQAAEFDYAGTQACQVLKQEGVAVVLVNSNPATIMTDSEMAEHIYLEPLTPEVLRRIILKEKPDSILPSLGGQTGLNLAMDLARDGFLEANGVRLLGAGPETIDKAEDRKLFKETMESIDQPCIPSVVTEELQGALDFAADLGYPIIVRPAFTLGGSGGGIAADEAELREIAVRGLEASPIHQILVEQCIAGWKEIEFEVIRDKDGNAIAICSMENFDPVGVHTGDSIVIAPAVTLADKEYEMLRSAALKIIGALGIEGGCNVQFALHPYSFDYAVIEVNPRVSRSSALASKATGYPIAKVTTRIALGYTLPEIPNAVTGGRTSASFEPAIDYVVVKFPKWPFDKFVYAKRTLGTQMKATGEVMSIAPSFEAALMKAVRGAEIGLQDLNYAPFAALSYDELMERLHVCDDLRLFALYAALKVGISTEEINRITTIDMWFLHKIQKLVHMEQRIKGEEMTPVLYKKAKLMGYPDKVLTRYGASGFTPMLPTYKMVDTCAGEFDAETPYFYGDYTGDNEAANYLALRQNPKNTIVVFGSGPIRIGQGIEFDYASVHCVWALRKLGYEVVIINNNPETVSTDFDTADRLYFEPLTDEDVWGILEVEKPVGVVVAFGGQTAIKLTHFLKEKGINILGTSADSIDMAEDREQFDELLESLHVARPKGMTVFTEAEAIKAANSLTYPVLMRPSYVLGGQNMIIAWNDKDIIEYMNVILAGGRPDAPILIDRYLMGTEIEVDAICDGDDILIPGVMEHIERAGVHSGDSIAVYPSFHLDDNMLQTVTECSEKLAKALEVKGLVNIQYLIFEGTLYVIEVNPRSSRTIPYLSKVTGVPMVELAVRAMLGEKLADMGYGTGLYPVAPYTAVKVPVFSFNKLTDVDTTLGPEMKSTGETLGVAPTLSEALFKGLVAAGYRMERRGGVLFSVKEQDRIEIHEVAKKFVELGCPLYATKGNAAILTAAGFPVTIVPKLFTGDNTMFDLMDAGKIAYVISTSSKGRQPGRDSVRMRRKAIERSIPTLTSIDTANALADCLLSRYSQQNIELVDINDRRSEHQVIHFAKLHAAGNDYICFDCTNQKIGNPAGLGVRLCHRHYGIGGEGVVLLYSSDVADFKMEMFNVDGTRSSMSGNAIRLLAKYAADKGYISGSEITVETDDGIKTVDLEWQYGKVRAAGVNMGQYQLHPATIPVKLEGEQIISQPVDIGKGYHMTCVNMGNPHAVMFVDDVDTMDVETEGSAFEHHPLFPERVNAEFVKVIDRNTLRARVWERGSGETWACGTGACAAVVAAILNGHCPVGETVTVKLLGGDLHVTVAADGHVHMFSTVRMIFEGTVEL